MMERELRFIRGLLIHIGLILSLFFYYVICERFEPNDLIWIALLGIPTIGITAISLAANFGKRG